MIKDTFVELITTTGCRVFVDANEITCVNEVFMTEKTCDGIRDVKVAHVHFKGSHVNVADYEDTVRKIQAAKARQDRLIKIMFKPGANEPAAELWVKPESVRSVAKTTEGIFVRFESGDNLIAECSAESILEAMGYAKEEGNE